MDTNIYKRLALRFGRVFLAGAIGAMATVKFAPTSWVDFPSALSALAFAGIVGGLAGLITSLDLYLRN